MKLFMFYVGGSCGNANVELHDVRFSIGETAEACYPDLRRQWWGTPESLHLDCWGEVAQADGHDIAVTDTPASAGSNRLFFVNLGGYNPAQFEELHRNVLVVAPTVAVAKRRALDQLSGWTLPHKDSLFEVERTVDISGNAASAGQHLRLTRSAIPRPFGFTCDYRPIA